MATESSHDRDNNDHDDSNTQKGSAPMIRLDLKKKTKKPKPNNNNLSSETKSQTATSSTEFFDDDDDAEPTTTTFPVRESVREYDGNKARQDLIQSSSSSSNHPSAADSLVIPVPNTGRVFGLRALQNQQTTSSVERKQDSNEEEQQQQPQQQQDSKQNTLDQEASTEKQTPKDDGDAEAVRALLEDAENPTEHSASIQQQNHKKVVIEAPDREDLETQQFHRDLEALPDAMDIQDYKQSRVSIADFGAAMLRGMGWTGEDDTAANTNNRRNNNTNNNSNEPSLPRPHRLGLGAIPKLEDQDEKDNDRRRPKTMDQYDRDKKLRQQAQEFARQRQRQVEVDKQQTLQVGSLVLLDSGQRAEIRQLMGVPGLNQIKVRFEGEEASSSVKRGSIERLLDRKELEETPFQTSSSSTQRASKNEEDDSIDPTTSSARRKNPNDESDRRRSKEYESHERKRRHEGERDDARKRGRAQDEYAKDHGKHHRKETTESTKRGSSSSKTWVIPQIRVRIITEKLGRRYFKEKGIVVDVTRKGSTIELDRHRSVLDRVPERYLETALPKVGGRVVVLDASSNHHQHPHSSDHLHSRGTLLERGGGRAVIQLDSDKSVLTLSPDDIAEWVGPIDDE